MSTVAVIGRAEQSVRQIAGRIESTLHTEVINHVVTNGHVDPLHGLQQQFDILVLVLSELWLEELQALLARPAAERPFLIVVGQAENQDMMRASMRAGARDYLLNPVDYSELMRSIRQIQSETHSRVNHAPGKIISLISAKGGSGASFIASSVASLIATTSNQSVALLDLDFQFGTQSLFFDVAPKQNLYDALLNIDSLDEAAFRGHATPVNDGISLFTSVPEQVPLLHNLESPSIAGLLAKSRQIFDFSILDLPRQIDIITATSLEDSDFIYIILEQTVAHIRDARRISDIITKDLAVPKDKITYVINRYQKQSSITLKNIETALPNPVVLPNDYKNVSESINLGVPLYRHNAKSTLSRSLGKLTENLELQNDQAKHTSFSKAFSGIFNR